MRKITLLLFTMLLLSVNICFAMDNAEKQKLHAELSQMIGDTGAKVPGLGVIVYKDGKEVYRDFLGLAIVDNKNPKNNRPFTGQSRFRAASVSKMFTVFTLMQLAEQGKLDLDADVSRYLGFTLRNPNYPNHPITARMLASHTSSLRDGKIYSIPPQISVREFFILSGKFYEDGAHFAPKGQEPGQYFSYCNLNYGILGTIIEKITGERFDKYQKSHILRQLDIKADYLPGNFNDKEFEKLGAAYQKKDVAGKWNENGPWRATQDGYENGKPQKDTVALQNPYHESFDGVYSLKGYVPGTNATPFSPAGGLRISCDELSHALSMLIENGVYKGRRVLSPDSVKTMLDREWIYDDKTKNGNTYGGTIFSYGLGMYQIDGGSTARFCKDKKIDLVGHTGEAFGLLSMLCLRPNTKDGFLYIMNGEAIEEDNDERSLGEFSNNYIWEERLGDAVCRYAFE